MQLNLEAGPKTVGQVGFRPVNSRLSEQHIITLALKQYHDPLQASLRELIINAVDAQLSADNLQDRVQVWIDRDTVSGYSTVRVRDFGPGMSEEFLLDGYFALGESTKRSDESQSGAFGLGAKAALIVSPVMQVTTYTGQELVRVVGQLVDGIQIAVSDLYREPSTERRGTEVLITVKDPEGDVTETEYRSSSVLGIVLSICCTVGQSGRYRHRPELWWKQADDGARDSRLVEYEHLLDRISADATLEPSTYRQNGAGWLLFSKTVFNNSMLSQHCKLPGGKLVIGSLNANQLDDCIVWHDARYRISKSLWERVCGQAFKSDVTSSYSPAGAIFSRFMAVRGDEDTPFVRQLVVSDDTVFQITTDRSAIVESDHNVELLAKLYQKAALQTIRSSWDKVRSYGLERFLISSKDPLTVQEFVERYSLDQDRELRQAFRGLITGLGILPEKLQESVCRDLPDSDSLLFRLLYWYVGNNDSESYTFRNNQRAGWNYGNTRVTARLVRISSPSRRRRNAAINKMVSELVGQPMMVKVYDNWMRSAAELDGFTLTRQVQAEDLHALIKQYRASQKSGRTARPKPVVTTGDFTILTGQGSAGWTTLRRLAYESLKLYRSGPVWLFPMRGASLQGRAAGQLTVQQVDELAKLAGVTPLFVRGSIEAAIRYLDNPDAGSVYGYFDNLLDQQTDLIRQAIVMDARQTLASEIDATLAIVSNRVKLSYDWTLDQWLQARAGTRLADQRCYKLLRHSRDYKFPACWPLVRNLLGQNRFCSGLADRDRWEKLHDLMGRCSHRYDRLQTRVENLFLVRTFTWQSRREHVDYWQNYLEKVPVEESIQYRDSFVKDRHLMYLEQRLVELICW